VFAKITYCLPVWFGVCTTADRYRFDSFLRRCVKLGFWSSNNTPCIYIIAEDIEDTLFNKVTHYQEADLADIIAGYDNGCVAQW